MKGDFTRSTFRPEKRYTGVRMQQGRVQLDADWNEQVDIHNRDERTARTDLIGASGAPQGDAGFEVTAAQAGAALELGGGRYYVDGIACENGAPVDLLGNARLGFAPPADEGAYLVYLDVWEHHVTALEDPDLREPALGGPDTATRTQVAWRARAVRVGESDAVLDCGAALATDAYRAETAAPNGTMRAQTRPSETRESDPCVVTPGARYTGLENQLYRVEIHSPRGEGVQPTFKWSRENGSVVTRWLGTEEGGTRLVVASTGRDRELGFSGGQWIEATDDLRELNGEPGVMAKLQRVDGDRLVLDASAEGGAASLAFGDFAGPNPKIRRWDSAGALPITSRADREYRELEDGIQVDFDGEDWAVYRTGDYWLVPARTLDGTIQWPAAAPGSAEPASEPPHGVRHHYAPLALVRFEGGQWTTEGPGLGDCRALFPPLTALTSFTLLGGEGQQAMPGAPLPEPLEVGVANGAPIQGALVRFAVEEGNGTLASGPDAGEAEPQLEIRTDGAGVARVRWTPASAAPGQGQRVTATLLGPGGAATPLAPIHFNASLSLASEVAVAADGCDRLGGPATVQDAIDRLCAERTIALIGGDGQQALPGEELPLALLVGVASGGRPVAGARVRFSAGAQSGVVREQAGPTPGSGELVVTTTSEGVAACRWRPNPDRGSESQYVGARLLTDDGRDSDLPPVNFTATVGTAAGVGYEPCERLQPVLPPAPNTVQQALDALCDLADRREEGIAVTGVFAVRGGVRTPLQNDGEVALEDFLAGLRVACSGPVDARAVDGRPTCLVTLDVPQTLAGAGGAPGPAYGFTPLVLAGQATAAGPEILWTPLPGAASFLRSRLPEMAGSSPWGRRRVAVHLTLRGSFIWERGRPDVLLDGELVADPGPGGAAARLPSGDGRRGGDLEMWFWLVSPAAVEALDLEPDRIVGGEEHADLAGVDLQPERVEGGAGDQAGLSELTLDPERIEGGTEHGDLDVLDLEPGEVVGGEDDT